MLTSVYISTLHLFTHGITYPIDQRTGKLAQLIHNALTKHEPITAVYTIFFDRDAIAYQNEPDVWLNFDHPTLPHPEHLSELCLTQVHELITAVANNRPITDTYPDNWAEIALSIKEAAGWQCEHCEHSHDITSGHCLTVHHLDGIKSNCDRSNLVALCQRCHLRIQAKWHPKQMFLFPPPTWASERGYH
jgi:hypothetical protein